MLLHLFACRYVAKSDLILIQFDSSSRNEYKGQEYQ